MHYIEIPASGLSEAALQGLLEEFVTRQGTDYGEAEVSTDAKIAQLRAAIARAEAKIVFEPESQATDIISAEQWSSLSR